METPDNHNPRLKVALPPKERQRLNAEIVALGGTVASFPVTDQQSFYNLRASIYDEQNESPERRRRQETMDDYYHQALRNLLTGKDLYYLDFGCGTGAHTAVFLEGLSGYARLQKGYGIDVSEEMVKIAGAKLPELQILKGSAEKLSFKEELDLVTYFFHVLCHLTESELELFFRNVSSSLKPGGVLCFDVI